MVDPETTLAALAGENSATIRMTDQFGKPVIKQTTARYNHAKLFL
jgi:hypothetical protein